MKISICSLISKIEVKLQKIFNCLNAGAWGFTSQLFGNVVEANNVITYAKEHKWKKNDFVRNMFATWWRACLPL